MHSRLAKRNSRLNSPCREAVRPPLDRVSEHRSDERLQAPRQLPRVFRPARARSSEYFRHRAPRPPAGSARDAAQGERPTLVERIGLATVAQRWQLPERLPASSQAHRSRAWFARWLERYQHLSPVRSTPPRSRSAQPQRNRGDAWDPCRDTAAAGGESRAACSPAVSSSRAHS